MDKLSDPGAMVSVASVSEETRSVAAEYLVRKGHEDLLPVLGLSGPEKPRGAKAVNCPTCGALVGAACLTADRKLLVRSHAARTRLAGNGLHGVSG